MKSSSNDFQNNYNRYMEKQVKETFKFEIGENFRAFQHQQGFNYMTNDGLNYNHLTLECLDSLVNTDNDTGEISLEPGGFSQLYYSVLDSASYTLGNSSQKYINETQAKYYAQATAVINAYKGTDLPVLTETKKVEAAISEIYSNCKDKFGSDVSEDCSVIPNSYAALKVAIQELNNVAGDYIKLVMKVSSDNAVLNSIKTNMINPSDKNGGIPSDSDSKDHYVGYSNIPDPNTLISSLGTESNSMTVSVYGDMYGSDEMCLTMDNEAKFTIPILNLVDISVEHKSIFNMDTLKTNEMEFSADITYSGITVVPVQPMPASIDGKSGWFAESTILNDIYQKTGDDKADGYKLVDSRYSVDDLFGNRLTRLKALLICKTPSISIKISNINMDYARSVFTTENDVDVKLFGFIELGGHKNSYQTTDVSFNDDEQSVTLTFGEPEASGTVDVKSLTAFVIGGVPYYPGIN